VDLHVEDRLDKDSPVALYLQLARIVERDIVTGVYPPGAQLPTENDFIKRHGVSRITVRQAFEFLVRRDLVVRQQGKGSFVKAPQSRQDLHELRGPYHELIARGIDPETKLLSFAPVTPPERIGRALALDGPQAMRLERLYLAEGRPFALARAWFTMEAEAVTPAQAAHHRSYEILESLLGLTIARVDVCIRARLAGTELAGLTGVAAEEPLLVIERVSYDPGERPIEFAQFHVNAEEYDLEMSVRGRMPVGARLRMTPR